MKGEAKVGPVWKKLLAAPWFICVVLTAITLAVFWSVRGNDFVNFDDQVYVTDNEHVRAGMTWENVRWAFGNLEAGFWHPMTWLSIMLDCQLYGLKAGGHHLTSLLLHTANSVLLFILLRRLTGAMWRSGFVAALFALHPLHVETVAWAADRKDVLSTFFLMLTLLAYVKYVNLQSPKSNSDKSRAGVQSSKFSVFSSGPFYYGLSLVLFALGLMSKTMLVTLPLVLLLLDWWPMGRFSKQDGGIKRLLIEKAPYFALSVIAGMLTLHAEKGVGALANAVQFPFGVRAGNALLSCWVYLRQLCWPVDLAVFYPYPERLVAWRVAAAGLLLAAVTVAAWKMRRYPYLLGGWGWYLVTLWPVMGLIQVGAHAHADRYTYVPLIGISVMVAWGLYDVVKSRRGAIIGLVVAGFAVVACCAVQANRQAGYWRNSEVLFRHAVEVTARNYLAFNNLGIELANAGKLEEAINCFRTSIEFQPEDPDAHANLGKVLAQQRHLQEAIREYEESLRLEPGNVTVLNNLGVAEAMGKKPEIAVGHFREAVRQQPADASSHNNLGLALLSLKRPAEAAGEFETSLRLKPNDVRVHLNLGDALLELQRLDDAVAQYETAVRLDVNNPETHCSLGKALVRQGRREEGQRQFQEALRINPDFSPARQALAQLNAAGKQ